MKNEPAFPRPYSPSTSAQNGMSLRDYFAAKAMQVVMPDNRSYPMDAAKVAYEFADAMLKARDK